MGQPTWSKIAAVTVPTRAANFWTPALDYLTAGKLYKITVETTADPADPAKRIDQKWGPESGKPCTADGDPIMVRKDSLMIDGCAVGALIAKVGGSAADLKPDKDKTVLFPVGRHCVFSVAEATKCGSLYLGMNDVQASLTKIDGRLEVSVFEGL
jgi:hypothetical protein